MIDRDEIIKAAHQYPSMGRIDDAIAEYRKILPYSVDGIIHNIIGDLYLRKESTDQATKYFREAAVMFNKEESHAKAIALYHKILSINPDQPDVVMELATLNAERGFITQAIEGMSRAAEAYYSKGLPMKALGVYKKALKVCPTDMELKIKIADLHLDTNHTDKAVKLYLIIAMAYESNAESVKAENMYKKVISLDPDNIASLIHLSRLAEDDQDLELAFAYMSKAAAIAPHNSEIMFDYSSLAARANKDISECMQQVPNGPVHNEPQNIHIPDAVNNFNKTGDTHNTLDLSSDSSNTANLHSDKPISTSSPLPVTSTGSGYEETGFSVPPDTGETGIDNNEIWDNSLDEDKNNIPVIDSILGKTSHVIPGHETAEAEYDQVTEEYEFDPSVKEPVHKKSEKDIRRLKKRVKTNRVHVLLIAIFTFVTAISFFITYKFLKNAQTVDVETPEHIISSQPYDQNTGEDIDISENKNKTAELNTTDEQPIKKSAVINTEKYPQDINQDEITVPDRESDTAGIDSGFMPYNNIEIARQEENNSYPDNTEDIIVSTTKPDRDAIIVTDEPQVMNQEELILSDKESEALSIDSEIIPDNIIEIAPVHKDSALSGNTDDSINPALPSDTETINEIEEPRVLNQGTLTVPVKESDTFGIEIDIMPDNSSAIEPEEEGNNYSNNSENNIMSTVTSESDIAQVQENTINDSGTRTVSDSTDDIQQEEDHKEKGTSIISFNEPFDNNNNNWDIVNTSAAHVRLKDGKYYIRNRRESGAYIILNGPYISTDLDFEVESHLNAVDPSESQSYGLIFGAKNKEDFFVFQILPENKYSIKKYFRGVAIELAGGSINSEPESQNFFNVLKINSKDNNLSFFINGNFINKVPDIFFSKRKTGFFVDRETEIVIDKLLLHHQSG